MTYRIIQISDCHLFANPQRIGYAGINPFQSLQQILHRAALDAPDKVVFSGDISSDDSAASYQHFQSLVSDAFPNADIAVIPGNHDDVTQMKALLPESWLKLNVIESFNGVKMVFLDSHYRGTQGYVSDSTLAWLGAELLSTDQPAFIFVHHHPIDTGSFMDKHNWINASDFLALLVNKPNPVYVMHGHIHHAGEKRHDEVHIWSAPSSCWQWKMSQEFGVSDEAPGYRRIDIDTSSVSTTVIRI